ncbi:M61 family metallopeptidase [Methylovorus glucosotrophus]|nr:PDZ domain-containing protein [Methylovorus glucosotrophus]
MHSHFYSLAHILMMSTISYQVRLGQPATHLFEVQCTIAKPDPQGQEVSLPAWIPGSYLVRDFARHIVSMEAVSSGKAVEIAKVSKHRWQCAPCKGPLTLRYQVYAYDLSVRTAYLDDERGYFNGSSLFLCVAGQEHAPCQVALHAPDIKGWQVGTALPAIKVNRAGFGLYQAPDYRALIDYPVEIGKLAIVTFKAAGIPHRLIVSGAHQADLKRIARDLKTLCETHIGFFGSAPFERYDFMLYAAGDDQYGGLEHRDSTSLICPRSWLPSTGAEADASRYQDFLGLCSHEYFHAWHVKRMRPQAFVEPDLGQEAYTRLLWVFEGFTAYYDTLMLVRSSLMSPEEYLKDLAKTITRYLRTPGRHVQRVDESSFDAWIKLYKPDENTPNAQISYYLKGSLVALAVDLTLRKKGSSLDILMQGMWRDYQLTGAAMAEEQMDALILKHTGHDLRKLLDKLVRGTEDPAFRKLFANVGIDYQDEAKPAASNSLRSAWGLQLANEQDTRVAHVYRNSSAEEAGLAAQDVIIAADGIKASAKQLQEQVARLAEGASLTLHFFRRDQLRKCRITKRSQTVAECNLHMLAEEHPLRASWLATVKNSAKRRDGKHKSGMPA